MPIPHSSSESNAHEKPVLGSGTVASSQSVPVTPEERLINEQSIRIKQWVSRRMREVGFKEVFLGGNNWLCCLRGNLSSATSIILILGCQWPIKFVTVFAR